MVRLSDLTDETTSPERQRTKITIYARLHEHEVVGLAEDLDVSGAISPFERPKLGPWLARPDDWDGLIVAKYDRLTRSLLDFLVLYKWLADRGKTLIWIDPPLDFSTPFGKAMANVLITFAELELAVISDRIREAWHTLREAGKWPGGTVPFGRIPVRTEPNGWRLALDPQVRAGRYRDGPPLPQRRLVSHAVSLAQCGGHPLIARRPAPQERQAGPEREVDPGDGQEALGLAQPGWARTVGWRALARP